MLRIPSNIVDSDWLHQHIDDPNLIVLDATIPKVTSANTNGTLDDKLIPFSRFFDIKNTFSDKQAEFPNTMLGANQFEKNARALGIREDSCLVVYDKHGVYSSPRAWYMFKSMGLDNIAVLNGGLPTWISKGYITVDSYITDYKEGNFKSFYQENSFVDFQHVLNKIDAADSIMDARSKARFEGTAPEPREGVRSGHIPNAISFPYSEVIAGYELKTRTELDQLFQEKNKENKPMIFSCGTGITACILALAASTANRDNFSVYDGSWTEWGSKQELPIEK